MGKPKFSNDGIFRISPSKILNYFYPMDSDIDEVILKKAGARGSIVHSFIENKLLGKAEEDYSTFQNYDLLQEKDFVKIEELKSSFESLDLLDFEDFTLEKVVETQKVRGIVDYIGKYQETRCIIDWKTNSSFGEKELTKATLQMNIYRLMLSSIINEDIPVMKIGYITKNKTKNRVKFFDIEIIPNEELISKINEAYNFYNSQNIITPKPSVNLGIETGGKMLITPMAQAREEKKKLIFILGEPKSGKTRFTNTLSDKKSLFIECGYDNGYSVLEDSKFDVVTNQVNNFIELDKDNFMMPTSKSAGDKLVDLLKEISGNLEQYSNNYDWLVLDPINNIQEEMQNFIETSKGKKMNMQDWGIIGNIYEDIKNQLMLIQTKMNICLISHTKTLDISNELTGESISHVIPNMTENNGKKFTKIADMIAYTTISKREDGSLAHAMIVGGNSILPTGIRSNKEIPTTPIKPDYQMIKEKLM